jgi:hypothetical protein
LGACVRTIFVNLLPVCYLCVPSFVPGKGKQYGKRCVIHAKLEFAARSYRRR